MKSRFSQRLLAGAFVLLAPTLAFGQTSTPTPGVPEGIDIYILRFNPQLSRLLIDDSSFPTQENDTVDNCSITVGANGPLVCITRNSCNNDRPACGMIFRGPPGLTLPDVAELVEVNRSSDTSSTATPSGPSLSGSLTSRAAARALIQK